MNMYYLIKKNFNSKKKKTHKPQTNCYLNAKKDAGYI